MSFINNFFSFTFGVLVVMSVFYILFFIITYILSFFSKKKVPIWEGIYLVFTFIFGFYFFTISSGAKYHIAIDPFSQNYEAFSTKHSSSLLVFLGLSTFFVFYLRVKKEYPPLLGVISICFVIIGIILNIFMFIQVTNKENLLFISPLLFIVYSVIQLWKIIYREKYLAINRKYSNTILNSLNMFLCKNHYLSVIILLFPIL